MGDEIVRTARGLELRDIGDVERLARLSVASGLLAVKRPEEAVVLLLTGRELGLSPMQSLRGIYVVSGRPVLSADLMVAVVRASGLCRSWRTLESTPERCTLETLRVGEEHPARRTWTREDAERAGLPSKGGTWKAYPAQMLRHRCAADLAREVYPDVLLGVYAQGELDEDQGPVETPSAYPLTERECSALIESIRTAGTLDALKVAWVDVSAEMPRASEAQRRELAAAKDARKAELSRPPPDGTSGPRRPSAGVVVAEGGSASSGGTGGPVAMDAAAYLGAKGSRREVELAVRAHGRAQGAAWLAVAAERLVALDSPSEEGARLSLVGATQLVERWAAEGRRRRAA